MYDGKIGWCHVCNQGWVSVVKTRDQIYYCLYEECETEWDSPVSFLSKEEGTHFKYLSALELSDEDIQNRRCYQSRSN